MMLFPPLAGRTTGGPIPVIEGSFDLPMPFRGKAQLGRYNLSLLALETFGIGKALVNVITTSAY
jgi:hypothetical protein